MFSSKLVPARVRGIVAVALAVGLSPVLIHGHHLSTAPGDLVQLAMKELMIGLAFAFVIDALFTAVAVAGSFLDTMIGFSYGSLVDPLTGTSSSVLQQAYSLIAVLIFMAIGGGGGGGRRPPRPPRPGAPRKAPPRPPPRAGGGPPV